MMSGVSDFGASVPGSEGIRYPGFTVEQVGATTLSVLAVARRSTS